MAIGKTNAGGGGTSLNFDVKRYSTEAELLAATPKENTIGIISEHEMTGWIMDANQPEELAEGMVWISVGTSSAVEFNALRKNGIQVYPLRAKQMVSGTSVDVTAMSYQGGKWVEWITFFFKDGRLVSNDWVAEARPWSTGRPGTEIPTITETENATRISITGNETGGCYRCSKKVNLKNVNRIVFDGVICNAWNFVGATGLFVWSEMGATYEDNLVAWTDVMYETGILDGKTHINTEGLNGEYYIGFGVNHKDSFIEIRNLYTE